MADKTFEIEFKSTATGNGAQQLRDDIQQVKDAVGEPIGSLPEVQNKGMSDQMQKDLDQVIEKTAEIKTELAGTSTAAGKLISQAGPLKNALSGLGQAMSGNPIGGLSNAFQSFMSTSAGAAARITAIGTAFAAGASLAYSASTKWAKAIADVILSFDPLMKGSADASGALVKLGNTKLSLKVQSQAVEDLIGKFEDLETKSEKALDSLNRLDSAQTKLGKAKIDNALQSDLGKTSDPGQQAALRAQADKAKSELDSGLNVRQADREVEALKEKQTRAETQISTLLEDTKLARANINDAEFLISDYAQTLGISYSEAALLAKDANGLQERINAALASSASEAEKTAITRAAKGLPEAVAFKDEAAKSVAPADAQIGQLRDLLAGLPQEIATAIAGRETVAVEANTQSDVNTQVFKTSLDDLQQSLFSAKGKLDAAKADNSAAQTGSGDLSKTYPAMQAAQAEVQRIQQMISEISTQAGGYTGALKSTAAGVSEALSNGGSEITKGAATIVQDTQAAAGVFTGAAQSASSSMVGAIDKLGSSVTKGFGSLANTIEGITTSLDRRLSSLETRLTSVADMARYAKSDAAQAQRQIETLR